MKKIVLFIPLILFAVLGFFLYQGLFLNPQQLDSALEGKPIPVFNLEKLEDAKQSITNKDLVGKVSLLNVWGTWCPSCKFEHPYLMKLAKQNILPIYGINYRDEREDALEELKTMGDPYAKNIYDHMGSLGVDLGVYGAQKALLSIITGSFVYDLQAQSTIMLGIISCFLLLRNYRHRPKLKELCNEKAIAIT